METVFYDFSEKIRLEGYTEKEIEAFQQKEIIENCDMSNDKTTLRIFERETREKSDFITTKSQECCRHDLYYIEIELVGIEEEFKGIKENLASVHYSNIINIECEKPNLKYLPVKGTKYISWETVIKLLKYNHDYKKKIWKLSSIVSEAKDTMDTILEKINKYKTSDKLLKDYPEFEKFLPQKALIELRNGPDQSFKKWINSMIKTMEEGETNE